MHEISPVYFDGMLVDQAEVDRLLAKLKWLRMRCHLYELSIEVYNKTDREDPAPGVTYGTAGWALMQQLSRRFWTPGDENRACEAAREIALRGA